MQITHEGHDYALFGDDLVTRPVLVPGEPKPTWEKADSDEVPEAVQDALLAKHNVDLKRADVQAVAGVANIQEAISALSALDDPELEPEDAQALVDALANASATLGGDQGSASGEVSAERV